MAGSDDPLNSLSLQIRKAKNGAEPVVRRAPRPLPGQITIGSESPAFGSDLARRNPPLQIEETYPTVEGSMQRKCGMAKDGHRYYLLSNKHPKLGAALNEWFCYQVAQECHISLPQYRAVLVGDEIYFGSQHVNAGGRHLFVEDLEATSSSGRGSKAMRIQLSRLYALDQMLANSDRRYGNLRTLDEGDVQILHAIDFSEAAAFGSNWHSKELLPNGGDTQSFYRVAFRRFGFEKESAIDVVDRLHSLPKSGLQDFVRHAQECWQECGQVMEQWDSWWINWRPARAEALYSQIGEMQ